MQQKKIHLVGFGSQGSAWAQCLRTSGWQVEVYGFRKSRSFDRASELGFSPRMIEELPSALEKEEGCQWIILSCPDSEIPAVYDRWISKAPGPIRLILIHGYAVHSGELKLQSPLHQALLLAPKAIGPKLLQNFQTHFPAPHSLVAAISSSNEDSEGLYEVTRGLGFDSKNLVSATFEQETVGDLISEQGLLCGGIFTLLSWTLESMARAGIPDALIREECLTELELIAGLIRERGPSQTFQAISQAAQCGAVGMKSVFESSNLKERFQNQLAKIQSGEFARHFQSSEWQAQAKNLISELDHWEERLKRKSDSQNSNKA